MLPPFRMGVGGKIGSGKQWMSWIALDDVVAGIQFALANDSIKGPVNFVAPNPVTNAEFTKTLGKALSRPDDLPNTGFRDQALCLGRWVKLCCWGGQRVAPKRLAAGGYVFSYPQLEQALVQYSGETAKLN